ncbi:MAG TPA: hypothetical protein VGR73_01210 [Bryobacteraceae bacterium]|nr:hypothetical protein [Bryobacteraceae bacterium]
MTPYLLLLAGLSAPALAPQPLALPTSQPPANAPWYSAATSVNTPNSFAAISGTSLADTAQALSASRGKKGGGGGGGKGKGGGGGNGGKR